MRVVRKHYTEVCFEEMKIVRWIGAHSKRGCVIANTEGHYFYPWIDADLIQERTLPGGTWGPLRKSLQVSACE